MTPVVRQLNATLNPDMMVALVDVGELSAMLYEEGIIETNTELHAGEVETSKMLYLAPETVQMDKAVDFVPEVKRPFLNYGSIFRATPIGVWGEPTKASAEKGKLIMERSIDLVIEKMNEIFDYMSKKERFGYSDF